MEKNRMHIKTVRKIIVFRKVKPVLIASAIK